MRAALYFQTSTIEQTTENQALELRQYLKARGWSLLTFAEAGLNP
jgi:DNA invertase Pin-like site-specific DNA recombinase